MANHYVLVASFLEGLNAFASLTLKWAYTIQEGSHSTCDSTIYVTEAISRRGYEGRGNNEFE